MPVRRRLAAITAQVDYFFNTAAPIVPEDAPNAPPNAVDDVLTTALDTALPINVFADLLANDSDANGDPHQPGQASRSRATARSSTTATAR